MRGILLALLLMAPPVAAGQLSIDEYGLKEVADSEGATVVQGQILSTTPLARGEEIELAVTRVFCKGAAGVQVGQRFRRRVYPGVEWTNPNKSPIEHRLRHKVGTEGSNSVVAVPWEGSSSTDVELLPATPEVVRTLAILFDAQVAARYPREPEPKLIGDLANPDLFELARAALKARGRLTTAALVGADPRLLAAHYHALTAAEQARFAEEAVALVDKTASLREPVGALLLREPAPPALGATARLLAKFDANVKDELGQLYAFHTELISLSHDPRGAADFSPLAGFLIVYETHRPDYLSSDGDLAGFTKQMDAAAKLRLAEGFLQAAYRSTHVPPGEPDRFLINEAARLAAEAPSPALLAPLATLDPSRPRVTSEKEAVMSAILRIAVAVAKSAPESKQKVRDLVEPWLDEGIGAPDDDLDAYRKEVGPTKKMAPRLTSFDLGVGEMRRLSTGARVRLTKDAQQGFSLSIAAGEERQSWGLDPKEDFYREWWYPPFLIIVKRLSSERVSVRFTPMEHEPPVLDDSAAYEMAQKISARRGCPEFLDKDHREFDGIFEYNSQGPSGKKCSMLIGVRTRKVIRLLP